MDGTLTISDLVKKLKESGADVDAQTIQSYIRQNEAAQVAVETRPSDKVNDLQRATAADPFPGTKTEKVTFIYRVDPAEAIAWLQRTEDRKRAAMLAKYGKFSSVTAPAEAEVAAV